jgi:hypothetical protein
MAGPFDNLTSAFDGNDPASYQQLLLRQKIADTMMKQAARRGYPKNVGEGLTAIGDALGERSQMNQMIAAQRMIEARRPAAGPAPGPDASATPSVQTSDASPQMPTIAPAATADASAVPAAAAPLLQAAANNDAYQPADALPPVQDAGGAPQMASADTGTMSDAPPMGVPTEQPNSAAVRASIAQLMQTRQGGSQPNPMLAGQSPASAPSTISPDPALLGSPLETNRPIPTDIQSVQLAENGQQPFQYPNPRPRPPASQIGPDTPVTPQTSAPLPNQAPGVYDKPIPPELPKRTQEDPRHQYLITEILRRKQMGDDPVIINGLEAQAAEWEKRRAFKDAENQRKYQSDLAQHNEKMQNFLTANQGLPMAKEKLTQEKYSTQKQAEEDQLKGAYGNLPPHIHTYLKESKDKAQSAVGALEGLGNAEAALNAGTLFGIDAPAKLLWYKAKAATGDQEAARIVAATETYKTSLGPVAAQAIRSYAGPQVSNNDTKLGFMMAGADYTLNEKSARQLIDIAKRSGLAALNEHRDNMDTMLKGQQGEERLRRVYDVPNAMPGIALPGGGPASFATEEAAKASNLPDGTPIMINGRRARIRR